MTAAPGAEWVHAIERAYVAAATGGDVARGGAASGLHLARARAALGAIASHYLAVGTPRTFGLIATAETIDEAVLSIAAHRAWFAPREIRCADDPTLAAAAGGVVASLAETLACDIVCVHAPLAIRAAQLRRGTHVNMLAAGTIDDDLRRLATVSHEAADLGALAAGLIDGRQLDELTVFIAGDAAIALGVLARSGRS
ncbi:MAG: hypothetical protein H0T89_28710 [Deltaproteobacteria bacterium]|nr:hypothetical protein [Deltaproteobacteria bacterium]MDQ3295521.1 hypothetical protein [Myxococcota bacterium]